MNINEDNIDDLIKQHKVGRHTRLRATKIQNSFSKSHNNIDKETESKSPIKANIIKWEENEVNDVDKIINEHDGIDDQLSNSNNSKTSTTISTSANKQGIRVILPILIFFINR